MISVEKVVRSCIHLHPKSSYRALNILKSETSQLFPISIRGFRELIQAMAGYRSQPF